MIHFGGDLKAFELRHFMLRTGPIHIRSISRMDIDGLVAGLYDGYYTEDDRGIMRSISGYVRFIVEAGTDCWQIKHYWARANPPPGALCPDSLRAYELACLMERTAPIVLSPEGCDTKHNGETTLRYTAGAGAHRWDVEHTFYRDVDHMCVTTDSWGAQTLLVDDGVSLILEGE